MAVMTRPASTRNARRYGSDWLLRKSEHVRRKVDARENRRWRVVLFRVTKDVVDRGEGNALGSHYKVGGSHDREERGVTRLEVDIAEVTIPLACLLACPCLHKKRSQ